MMPDAHKESGEGRKCNNLGFVIQQVCITSKGKVVKVKDFVHKYTTSIDNLSMYLKCELTRK